MHKFSTEFPSPTIPTLPEYFKKDTLGGLIPGYVAYPYTHLFKSDTRTGLLYVKTGYEIDAEAMAPKYFGERVGVMRIFEQVGDEVVDGYIADFRRVQPGNIGTEMFLVDENASEFDRKMAATASEGAQLLLATVFADPDGNPHYMGDERLRGHVLELMAQTDAAAAPKQPAAAPAADASASSEPYIGGVNYLG